jgi:hypothetical protein
VIAKHGKTFSIDLHPPIVGPPQIRLRRKQLSYEEDRLAGCVPHVLRLDMRVTSQLMCDADPPGDARQMV